MTTFVALYRGPSVSEARLIAVSVDPKLVAEVSTRLLQESSTESDPIIADLERGRQKALRLIKKQASEENG